MGDQYAIIGVAKLKTKGNVAGVLAHMFRERPTPNSNGLPIDTRIKPNGVDGVMDYVNQFKKRKGSVIAYDFLLTASPEFFDRASPQVVESWKQDSRKWLEETFGKENLVALVFHDKGEETTCHAQAVVIPQKDGRLNARYWTGGRERLRALWSSYAEAMRGYGLKRGRMFSPAEHTSIKEYYAQVHESERRSEASKVIPKQLPTPTIGDRLRPQEYAVGLINHAVEWYRRENATLRTELNAERKRAERMINRTSQERERVQFLKENPEELSRLESELAGMRREKAETVGRYEMLLDAVKEYFRKNVPANSPLRSPERLGTLGRFPELARFIRLSLRDASFQRPGQELERG